LPKPLTDEISRGANSIQLKLTETIENIYTRYGEYSKKLREMKAEARKFEEEIRLARIFSAIHHCPF